MNFFFAFLAESERAFTDAAQSRAHVTQSFGIAVDVGDGERTFGSALNFIHLIRLGSMAMPSRWRTPRSSSASRACRMTSNLVNLGSQDDLSLMPGSSHLKGHPFILLHLPESKPLTEKHVVCKS